MAQQRTVAMRVIGLFLTIYRCCCHTYICGWGSYHTNRHVENHVCL
ncbi:TPA: hypothetical protein TUU90_000741 [Streptococcus equi subsp. zooepidemicus]|nr:hypothetical protein [Streptococcus equi subsp. zooepidemicus]